MGSITYRAGCEQLYKRHFFIFNRQRGGGADIGPLGAQGAVLFGLATIAHRYFDYHHSENDVIENVNERELALGAAAVAHLAAALADG